MTSAGSSRTEVPLAVAARDLEDDERDRGDRGGVEEPEARPRRARGDDADEHGRRGRGDEQREREPLAGEDAARQDLADRRAGPLGDDRAAEQPDGEADRRPRQRERGRLGDGDERELPAAGAVPGEPAAGGEQIGPQRHRREQREREQERRGLAADDAEPAARGRLVACASRSSSTGATRSKLDVRPGARSAPRDAGGQVVHLPQPRPAGAERRHPGVAAVDAVERGAAASQRATPSARKSGGGGGRW